MQLRGQKKKEEETVMTDSEAAGSQEETKPGVRVHVHRFRGSIRNDPPCWKMGSIVNTWWHHRPFLLLSSAVLLCLQTDEAFRRPRRPPVSLGCEKVMLLLLLGAAAQARLMRNSLFQRLGGCLTLTPASLGRMTSSAEETKLTTPRLRGQSSDALNMDAT